MDSSKPVRMVCTYRVKDGKEADFLALLEKHWPTLRDVDLATDDPAQVFRSRTRAGKTVFVEMFSWKDAAAPDIAQQTPEVLSVWEPMLALADKRIILPVEAVAMNFA
jgi:quinol monooxygenase YgiN